MRTAPAGDPVAALRLAAAARAGRADLLVLHVGEERHAVPLAASAEVVRLGELPGDGELVYRGERVPLLDAAAVLGVPTPGAPRVAAVLRGAGATFAVAVSAAVPVHGADLAGVGAVPWPDDGILLGVLPHDDTVVALIDVDALAALAAARAAPFAFPSSQTPDVHP